MLSRSNKAAAISSAKFVGTIKTSGNGFIHLTKFVIAVSIVLAILMFSIRWFWFLNK